MEKRIVKLSGPVKGPDGELTQLEFRAPRAKDMRKIKIGVDGMEMGILMDLASILAGVPTFVIDSLEPKDALEVCGVIGDFIMGGPATPKSA